MIRASTEDINADDPERVFYLVFSALPIQAFVYPSGNHYYFEICCRRGVIRGNLRLGEQLRDQGMVGLTYSLGVPGRDQTTSVRFGRAQGLYMVRWGERTVVSYYRGHVVVFQLHRLVTRPLTLAKLLPGESWVVPVFDESGLPFYLAFQRDPAHFFWVLNRDASVAEAFDFPKADVAVGRRTRFAFFVDQANHRWILVGVDRRNSDENTWYDGPFDQLPERANVGPMELRKYLEAVYPNLHGQIDEYGRYKLLPDYDMPVAPWRLYDKVEELGFIDECKQKFVGPAFYACITPDRFTGRRGK